MDFNGGNMSKKYKTGIIIAVITFIVILGYNILIHGMSFFMFSSVFMPSRQIIENDLYQYEADLLIVVNYLESQKGSSIYITDINEVKITYKNDEKIGRIETDIVDQEVVDAIDFILNNSRFNVILGNSDNFIEFQRWSTLDKSCGLAYSFSGDEPTIEYLTELVSLPQSGWYYYVSNEKNIVCKGTLHTWNKPYSAGD